MPKRRPSRCKQCQRYDTIVGVISKRGLCRDCGTQNMVDQIVQVQNRQGLGYERWQQNTLIGHAEYYKRLSAKLDEQYRAAEQNYRRGNNS